MAAAAKTARRNRENRLAPPAALVSRILGRHPTSVVIGHGGGSSYVYAQFVLSPTCEQLAIDDVGGR